MAGWSGRPSICGGVVSCFYFMEQNHNLIFIHGRLKWQQVPLDEAGNHEGGAADKIEAEGTHAHSCWKLKFNFPGRNAPWLLLILRQRPALNHNHKIYWNLLTWIFVFCPKSLPNGLLVSARRPRKTWRQPSWLTKRPGQWVSRCSQFILDIYRVMPTNFS